MKILHVAEVLVGGIATYLNEILPGHAARHPEDVIKLICPEEHLKHLSPAVRQSVIVEPYTRSGRNPQSLFRLWRHFRRALKEWQPDIVQANSSFAGGICRLPGAGLSQPLIYCPHGWSFDQEASVFKRGFFAILERILERRAHVIVAISNHERRIAAKIGLDPNHIEVVRYGLSTDRTLRGERPLPNGPALQLLFIGRFDRQKGLDWLLDVIGKLPPDRIQLRLIGAAVLGTTSHPALPPNAENLGWIPADRMDSYIDTADAVIMPSRWEGFGLVATEAMRRAVPVLASSRSALPEIVGDAGLIFDLEDPESLNRLLLGMDRKVLFEMGKTARERFLKYFTVDRMVDETLTLYRTVLQTTESCQRR